MWVVLPPLMSSNGDSIVRLTVRQWGGPETKLPSGGEDFQPSTKSPSVRMVLSDNEDIGLAVDGIYSPAVP